MCRHSVWPWEWFSVDDCTGWLECTVILQEKHMSIYVCSRQQAAGYARVKADHCPHKALQTRKDHADYMAQMVVRGQQRAAGRCWQLRGGPARRSRRSLNPAMLCLGAAVLHSNGSDKRSCRLVSIQYVSGGTQSHGADQAHASVFNKRVRCSMRGAAVVSDANHERAASPSVLSPAAKPLPACRLPPSWTRGPGEAMV